jgi:quercetin dioxygenase-like cupin family protein
MLGQGLGQALVGPACHDDAVRIYRLPAHEIERFDSSGVSMMFLPCVDDASRSHVNVARIAAGGTLGEHPATTAQAFAVVSGKAIVSSGTGPQGERRTLTAGHAVVWETGEVHQTWAVTDVVATIVEAYGDDVVLGLDDNFVELGTS